MFSPAWAVRRTSGLSIETSKQDSVRYSSAVASPNVVKGSACSITGLLRRSDRIFPRPRASPIADAGRWSSAPNVALHCWQRPPLELSLPPLVTWRVQGRMTMKAVLPLLCIALTACDGKFARPPSVATASAANRAYLSLRSTSENLVVAPSNITRTSPVGPWRCLATCSSALPATSPSFALSSGEPRSR
jgi:hypothetical protein